MKVINKKIAVVGFGHWGKNLVRNFGELNSLHAICDEDEDKLKSFKDKYPAIITYSSFCEVLKNSDIQGVVIASPTVLHYSMAKEALLHDKDVFVEKPLSLEVKQGEELIRIAKEKNRILMVGHILHYHQVIHKIKELIDSGDLGKIQYIYSNRLNLGKIRTEENILWSYAPHDISVILSLLGEFPESVTAQGSSYISKNISDVTLTTMNFDSGTRAHIFVSWLHPFKEQKLVIVGDKKMAVFDDTIDQKLVLYPHSIKWVNHAPIVDKAEAQVVDVDMEEPLKLECQHFLNCIESRKSPVSDGEEGLRVLKVLDAFQESMNANGKEVHFKKQANSSYFVHETAWVDNNVEIGAGTKIWHVSHILKNSKIGEKCNIGQNVVLGPNVVVGNNCKIQNNVSIYKGITLEDDVFCGPSMVFTNVLNPRSAIPRMGELKQTLVKKGATIGANATIICGITIGKYAFIGAGAVVTKDVLAYELVKGNPARVAGWMCECGVKLPFANVEGDDQNMVSCEVCARIYTKEKGEVKECSEMRNSKLKKVKVSCKT